MQDGQRIAVGECVELQPAAGETLPMVAQIQALWSERPADGQERMLARVCRFYRPQVLFMHRAKRCRHVPETHAYNKVGVWSVL